MKTICSTLAIASVFGLGVALFGCDSKVPTDSLVGKSSGSQTTSKSATNLLTKPSSGDSSDTSYGSTNSWETDPDLQLTQVPDSLKALPCFEYEGFAGNPVILMMTASSSKNAYIGQVSLHLKKVTEGAYFAIVRTGSLGGKLGNDLVVLRKDGVFDVANSRLKLSKVVMEMPAQMKAGTTWSANMSANSDNSTFEQNINLKLSGPTTVDLPTGSTSAMVIDSSGTYSQNGETFKTHSAVYCVKNGGELKTVLTTVGKNGKPVTMTIQPATQQEVKSAQVKAKSAAQASGGLKL